MKTEGIPTSASIARRRCSEAGLALALGGFRLDQLLGLSLETPGVTDESCAHIAYMPFPEGGYEARVEVPKLRGYEVSRVSNLARIAPSEESGLIITSVRGEEGIVPRDVAQVFEALPGTFIAPTARSANMDERLVLKTTSDVAGVIDLFEPDGKRRLDFVSRAGAFVVGIHTHADGHRALVGTRVSNLMKLLGAPALQVHHSLLEAQGFGKDHLPGDREPIGLLRPVTCIDGTIVTAVLFDNRTGIIATIGGGRKQPVRITTSASYDTGPRTPIGFMGGQPEAPLVSYGACLGNGSWPILVESLPAAQRSSEFAGELYKQLRRS